MSGELTNLIAILGVGIALATLMLAMFRWQDRRFDDVNQRFADVNRRLDGVDRRFEILEADVKQLIQDVAEVKGSLNTIHRGLRIQVGEPPQ